MKKRKRNLRYRMDARQYNPEKVIKSLTQMYKPARKLPEAESELRYSTKKKDE